MTIEEIHDFVRAVFSFDELQVVRPEVVSTLKIPELSKEYLLEVGLPREPDIVNFKFNLLDSMPPPQELFPDLASQMDSSWASCRLLGCEYDLGFYLNEAEGGAVFGFGGDAPDFINSSVESLGLFLAEYHRPRPGLHRASPEERAAIVKEMKKRMIDFDSRAFDNCEGFWAVVVEEAEVFG